MTADHCPESGPSECSTGPGGHGLPGARAVATLYGSKSSGPCTYSQQLQLETSQLNLEPDSNKERKVKAVRHD